MKTAGLHRIESQLMMQRGGLIQPPFQRFLRRHDRYFMEAKAGVAAATAPRAAAIPVGILPWSERYGEEIAHLVSAAYRGHVDSDINDQYRSIPGARHFLMNIIKFPGCGNFSPEASLVAIDARTNRVCGVCLASLVSAASGHVTQLCVLPALRGANVGYELIRHCMLKLLNLGCQTVSLTVTCTNENAIRLYEALGFRAITTFPALVWEGF